MKHVIATVIAMFWSLMVPCLELGAVEILTTQPGSGLNDDPVIRARRVLVLYIANDVSVDAGGAFGSEMLALREKLLNSKAADEPGNHRFFRELIRGIEQSIDLFNDAVDRERLQLIDGLARVPGMSLAILRNSGRNLKMTATTTTLLVDGQQRELKSRYRAWASWEHSNSPELDTKSARAMIVERSEILASHELEDEPRHFIQPLTNPGLYSQMWDRVLEKYPPEEYRYLLMIKSHGDEEHWLMPWLCRPITKMDGERLAEAVLRARDRLIVSAGRPPTCNLLSEFNRALATIPGVEPERNMGIKKREALEHLAGLGGGDPRAGAYFPIVLLSVNRGALSLSADNVLARAVRPGDYTGLHVRNIGSLVETSNDLTLDPIDLEPMFKSFRLTGIPDLQDRWGEWLKMKIN